MTIPTAVLRPRTIFTLFLALVASLLLLSSGSASAASPVAKDGKIYACFKAKGKAKGDLRLLRGAKARCPRKWQKVAWQATSTPGPRGEAGAPGRPGSNGQAGASGLSGVDAGAAVVGLEAKVAQLLLKVESLEGVVEALCTQGGVLTNRLNVLEGVLGGLNLNGVLTTLGGLLNIPALPGALPAFNCPTA